MAVDPALIPAVRASAQRLGVNPSDLLTAMSYETGGKLDPNLWGGKNNHYLGLIQFGPAEQKQYGVTPGMSVADQVGAAENFLRDRGVKPGMGLLDIYSTINAGSPGLYGRSDANNGGAPGTVYDKVTQQMAGHRARAERLLAAQPAPQDAPPAQPQAPAAPTAAAAAPPQPTADAAPPTLEQPGPIFGSIGGGGSSPAGMPAQPWPVSQLASWPSASAAAPQVSAPQDSAAPAAVPFSLAPGEAPNNVDYTNPAADQVQQQLAALPGLAQQQSTEAGALPLDPIRFPEPPGLARARIANLQSNPRLQLAQRLIAAMAVPGQNQGTPT